jgi:Xaa-Pro aminopeptidase
MVARGLAAMLISLPANRYYLSGFELHNPQPNESAGYLLLLENGEDLLFTDSRYLEVSRRLWSEDNIRIYESSASSALEINRALSGRLPNGKFVGFEAKIMSVDFFEIFSKNLPVKAADGLIEKLRIIKEPGEIRLMRETARLNHKLMAHLPSLLVPGETELEIAWKIEQFFRNSGASENAFAPIVAVGPNGALPHAIPGADKIVEECPVLVDAGARINDYNSDQTRSFWVGANPAPEFSRALEQVKEAQRLAIEAIKPGERCADIFFAAHNYLARQGVAEYFTHGLGHGVGLETHEEPSLSSRSDQILAPGMIVTVEPGLYYPQWGGIRWEYMVLVTETGGELL